MTLDCIRITGARQHNLRGIDVDIPRGRLVVVTGVSGSGKSSLAFDTIYAEGQRRYVESLSAYARQFLEQMDKPDVEHIEGLSPAIAIEQRTAGANPRSTVGTMTEIHDYLRLLFARAGIPHCCKCGDRIKPQTVQQIVDGILAYPPGTKVAVLAPLVAGRKGEYQKLFERLRREGFLRVRVDGETRQLESEIRPAKNKVHTIELIVDRLAVSPGAKERLTESVETALREGAGVVKMLLEKKGDSVEEIFSEHAACLRCGLSFEKPSPRMFSFNSPYGACPVCDGLGTKLEIDPAMVIPDDSKSLSEGAVLPWRRGGRGLILYYYRLLRAVAGHCGIDMDTPFAGLTAGEKRIILYGTGDEQIKQGFWRKRKYHRYSRAFEGVIPNLERRFRETESEYVKQQIHRYMSVLPCPACGGARLKKESLSVYVKGMTIARLSGMSVKKALGFFSRLDFPRGQREIADEILKEIIRRLEFLKDVGLDYLTLDRPAGTLSGGETERVRLATQIGSGLTGVLYILDEPSIGLHQRDNRRLLRTLLKLRDLGNTVIIVEHDEATIRSADYIVDLGPGAGLQGGRVVACGSPGEVMRSQRSVTGKYLKGELRIEVPAARRKRGGGYITIKGAREHNLKNIDVKIPTGVFTCVTGVSGSGKSTLIDDILNRAAARALHGSGEKPGMHDKLLGMQNIDKSIVIDQSPIGRTPRSNPATYTDAFSHIRDLFSRVPESRARGYKPGRFSFNVKGGRCEKCRGDGALRIEMHFLPDVSVVCQECRGRRYNRETLEIRYKGKNIHEVLEMDVGEAMEFFGNIPRVKQKLKTLNDVGMGYIKLGQPATTLSGGEAQRIKLSKELSRRSTGRTLYILDEPTTGLHFDDVRKLLEVIASLTGQGNTMVVIEHNIDVIKSADHIIDLGPEGGERGGRVVAEGSPEEVAGNDKSHTGRFLRKAGVGKGG